MMLCFFIDFHIILLYHTMFESCRAFPAQAFGHGQDQGVNHMSPNFDLVLVLADALFLTPIEAGMKRLGLIPDEIKRS